MKSEKTLKAFIKENERILTKQRQMKRAIEANMADRARRILLQRHELAAIIRDQMAYTGPELARMIRAMPVGTKFRTTGMFNGNKNSAEFERVEGGMRGLSGNMAFPIRDTMMPGSLEEITSKELVKA